MDRPGSQSRFVEFESELGGSGQELYTIEGVFRPVTNGGGEVVSLLISDRDITEQKRRERTRTGREPVPGVPPARLGRHHRVRRQRRIRYESPSIQRHMGYDQEDLVGENAIDYVIPTIESASSRPSPG